MTLNQIRNVVAVAERGSQRRAARHLGVTQPAVIRSIRELEHELGVTLFERKATGMTLSLLGTAFVRRATRIQNEVERIGGAMEQLKGHHTALFGSACQPPHTSRCCRLAAMPSRYCAMSAVAFSAPLADDTTS